MIAISKGNCSRVSITMLSRTKAIRIRLPGPAILVALICDNIIYIKNIKCFLDASTDVIPFLDDEVHEQ